ncbi:hypothetical protein [Azospirillum sp. TSO35-2]|uniref:hypothetical protein n=1 Tax=Azospirillum sp. TSO35-2 TaxID=716796 RepID=UPI000D6152B9|nr:hypothetical protein [Azospirillum sp. TSO35-2]PWC33934.1 hypothetical protein TSO352_26660 [Azospirillum sp. TSO35-2]
MSIVIDAKVHRAAFLRVLLFPTQIELSERRAGIRQTDDPASKTIMDFGKRKLFIMRSGFFQPDRNLALRIWP